MSEDDYELEDRDEGEDEDDGDDEPGAVYVGMHYGKEGAEEAFRVIGAVCERLELEAVRARMDQVRGGGGAVEEAIDGMMENCDFAILDLTHERPSLSAEIALADDNFDREFILLIAKAGGAKKPADIEGRVVHSYSDKGDLRAVVERHLNAMMDAWNEGAVDDGDEDDEEE